MPNSPRQPVARTHQSLGLLAVFVLLGGGCPHEDEGSSDSDAGVDGGFEADTGLVDLGDAESPETDGAEPDHPDSGENSSDRDAEDRADAGVNPSGGDDAADPSPADGGVTPADDAAILSDGEVNPVDGEVSHELDSGALNDAGFPTIDSGTVPLDPDAAIDASPIAEGGTVIDAALPGDPPCTSSFDAPRQWTRATSLDSGELVALANNARGDIVAVFNRRAGATQTLWARYAEPGEAFGEAVQLGATTGEGGVKVALNARGDAFVAWVASADSSTSLIAARFAKSTGWSEVEPATSGEGLTVGGIALQSDGRATIGWMEQVNPQFVLPNRFSAKEFVPGTGWHQAASIEQSNLFPELLNGQPAWEGAPSGALMLMWATRDANDYASLWSSRYTPNAGWEVPVRVQASSSSSGVAHSVSSTTDRYRASLVVANDGSAIATWQEFFSTYAEVTPSAGSQIDLYMSRYTPGTGWGAPEVVPTYPRPLPPGFLKRSPMQPLIVGNRDGDLIAFWWEGLFQLYGTFFGEARIGMSYTPVAGWNGREPFSDNDDAFVPSVARVDCAGNGLAANADFTSMLLYRADIGFAGPRIVDVQNNAGVRTSPQLLIDYGGRAIAVWNVAGSAWWSRYQPDPT